MLERKTVFGRAVAAAIAVVALVTAAPQAAFAADEENPWSRWASAVTDRELKAEVPFAVLVSIPMLAVATPVWLVEMAVDGMTSEE